MNKLDFWEFVGVAYQKITLVMQVVVYALAFYGLYMIVSKWGAISKILVH